MHNLIFIGGLLFSQLAASQFSFNRATESFLIRRYTADMKRLTIHNKYIWNPILYAMWKVGHNLETFVKLQKFSYDLKMDRKISETARDFVFAENAFFESEGVLAPRELYSLWSAEAGDEINRQARVYSVHRCPKIFRYSE